ncbi:MAG: uroporphyrinogen decarboxylase family protein [Armatimonadota bacterium]
MTSKERVHAAINRQKVDRVPRYLWFHPDILSNACRRLGTSGFATEAALGNDILQPWVSINASMARQVAEGVEFTDDFGITWLRRGLYNTVVHHPLMDADVPMIQSYPMPDATERSRYTVLEELMAKFGHEKFIGADVSGSIFEPAYHLRNMENLLIDMMTGAEEAEALFDRIMAFTIAAAKESLRRGVDWVWLGDDVGTQTGMIMSPRIWRKMLKPRMKRIIDELRSVKPEVIIAYHSCGSIRPIIGDLVEIGINVLNPLQPMAADMDNLEIKREYGSVLSFMAGIDTQGFLPNASPQEVKGETRRIIDTMGDGGGFIFAGSHTIQTDVPWANIEAMLEELG